MTSPSSLSDWLQLLESRHPTEIDLGLDRIAKVADRLSLGAVANTVVTVAGTNGKGSCIAMLESVLLASNHKVGTYTSPHLLRYNERICINGEPVSDSEICDAFLQIEQARKEISLTYFEFGSLAAFLIMAKHSLDLALLEVGLGGRLDAVNLIDADYAVVTSIALDHEQWLGDDINQIAAEKASIARRGRPLIYGENNPYPSVIALSTERCVPLLQRGQAFDFLSESDGISVRCQTDEGGTVEYQHLPHSTLPQNSFLCALQTLSLLDRTHKIDSKIIAKGIKSIKLKGRYQQCHYRGVDIILDVAHNPAASQNLADMLREQGHQPSKNKALRFVIAVMSDKDVEAILAPLRPLSTVWYPTEIPNVERALSSLQWTGFLYNTPVFDSAEDAFEKALSQSRKGDVVVVCGSFLTVAAALKWLRLNEGFED